MGPSNSKPAARPRATGSQPTQGGVRSGGTNVALVTPAPREPAPRSSSQHQDVNAAQFQIPNTVPVVVRFKVPQKASLPGQSAHQKAAQVHVAFEFDGWQPREMTKSVEDFFATAYVPPGTQAYKFFMNGTEYVDQGQQNRAPTMPGGAANLMTISEAMLQHRDDDFTVGDDSQDWGQKSAVFEETRKMPPILPPHMRYTPLSNPPTQYRLDPASGQVAAVPNAMSLDPEHLPMPMTVTINHVYFQRREDHVVVGVTTRFKNKFTSVVYYKGDNQASKLTETSSLPVRLHHTLSI